jgi:hypothetical protein
MEGTFMFRAGNEGENAGVIFIVLGVNYCTTV